MIYIRIINLKGQTKKIVEMYDEGYSLSKIGEATNVNRLTIAQFLEKILIREIGKDKRKYKVNDNFFSEKTKESVYWAGFIAGDGHIHSRRKDKKKNAITIGLSIKDKNHIKNLQNLIEHKGKLYEGISKTSKDSTKEYKNTSFTFVSQKICSDLEKIYDIKDNKTYTYIPPNDLKDEEKRYFILGLLDADGSLSYTRNKRENRMANNDYIFNLRMNGTRDVCYFVRDYLGLDMKIIKEIRNPKNDNQYVLSISGNKQIYKILKELYGEDTKDFVLTRKYERFLKLKKQHMLLY